MIADTDVRALTVEGDEPRYSPTGVARRSSRAVGFSYDDEQIFLDLLRGRAAEEDRRRFVVGLRRLDGSRATSDS